MPAAALKHSHTVTLVRAVHAAVGLRRGHRTHRPRRHPPRRRSDAPYHIARRFASLDHISGGRAGWNIVTTANPDAAKNFGGAEQMEHDARYVRAREFYDVVTGLWDSFDDDAFVRDVEAGIYVDPAKMHTLDHKGPSLDVRGPLNIARPVQGWPVIVQAGASDAGRQLAAETAEVVFGAESDLEAGRRYYADIKGRMRTLGRNPAHCKIMPAAFVVVGETDADGPARSARISTVWCTTTAVSARSTACSAPTCRATTPTGPLPEIPPSNANRSSQARIVEDARANHLTIRQLAQKAGSASYLSFVGTPATIADGMADWLQAEACDGFNVMFSHLPQGLDDFAEQVVPELQRRGLFRTDYAGPTLRDHLGLPRPRSRYDV